MKNIELSIIITTFNQEKYVEKAIQSAINQKTSFIYEILIGDDCSTDETKEICIRYAQNYPDIIVLESRNINLGLIDNYIDLFKKAKGKYIAFLEGDDYWIDVFKIQKQFSFLENNDFALIYTNSYLLNDSGSKTKKYNEMPIHHTGNLYDVLLKDNHIVAITICFEKEFIFQKIIEDYEYIKNFQTLDYYIILAISKSFKIAYLNELTSVYRVHAKSISNTNDFEKKKLFLKSSYDIKKFFLLQESIDLQKNNNIQARYFYDLFFISLQYEIIGVSRLDIDLNEINNKFLYMFFRFKIIRKVTRPIYFLTHNLIK